MVISYKLKCRRLYEHLQQSETPVLTHSCSRTAVVSMALVFFKNIHSLTYFMPALWCQLGFPGSCSLTITQRLLLSEDCTDLFLTGVQTWMNEMNKWMRTYTDIFTGATLLDNTFQRRSLMLTPAFDIITSTEQSNPTGNWNCINSVTK